MTPLFLTAATMVSAIGRGNEATLRALDRREGGLRPCDFGGIEQGHIGRVEGLDTHVMPAGLERFDCRNNRLADMALGTDGFSEAVGDARARYGPERIAVIIGTSTSGVLSYEEAYRDRDEQGDLPPSFDHEHTQDVFSAARYVRSALDLSGPTFAVSTACASSSKSLIDAHHLMAAGLCDAAVVGGVDTLCRLTLRGFASLDLISDQPCRPCDVNRSGISIGEGAGLALIERRPRPTRTDERPVALLGYGATSDGYHISSPHPEGTGAIAAMRQALARAGLRPGQVDYVNLHGTGTRANDAMEDLAVAEVFGTDTPCSSSKGWMGHTLGAAGIMGALITRLAILHDLVPGSLSVAEVDPSFRSRVVVDNAERRVRRSLSNAFGFGGINCSLLLGDPG
ncbi:beta-ketoacyl-[acyl-carrier-protein] synthase family protein [Marinivivus vitaminiproducens]|uniref:beta-ketoacyl-[acyl-carrier-protein] synthase family protein n=1 Tax=Marinivivus vitaminiproducens TaxID=3035935 RepID=UPI002798FBB5|nr:beta-ketoacyl-[acyl-carrier-protein] synthase family protein [Geminicoccaceae bacterium SCSIO 64248]